MTWEYEEDIVESQKGNWLSLPSPCHSSKPHCSQPIQPLRAGQPPSLAPAKTKSSTPMARPSSYVTVYTIVYLTSNTLAQIRDLNVSRGPLQTSLYLNIFLESQSIRRLRRSCPEHIGGTHLALRILLRFRRCYGNRCVLVLS